MRIWSFINHIMCHSSTQPARNYLFWPYRSHGFVLDDYAWLKNMSNKSSTSTTNKVSYQILIRRCGRLQSIYFKELDNLVGITGQPVRLTLILNVTVQPSQPDIVHFGFYRRHGFVLGDHARLQNAHDKSATSTTNKVNYQILTHRCEILHHDIN